MAAKRNPQDATRRNIRASKRREAKLEARIVKLETAVKQLQKGRR